MSERRNYLGADEATLLGWAQAGDQRAFAALVEPHGRKVRAVCLRILGDDQLAQDAAQNALLAAWKHLERFEGRARFSTWLCQIAHNAALAIAKGRRADPVDEVPERGADPVGGGSRLEAAEDVDEVHAVRWALGKLPPDFRAALVLREYGGLSYQEIAEAQSIPIDTVKSRINRARQGLAALLREATTGPSLAGA